MIVRETVWERYARMLSAIHETAGKKYAAYLRGKDLTIESVKKAAIDYAYQLAARYGESAAALACEMYDAVALASGAAVPAAVPAASAEYGEVAKAINDMIKEAQPVEQIGAAVGRLVKRQGADTSLKNAIRDGAEFAWVPHGDSCSFCLMLASNGWRRASKKTLKGDHAEHIHANCDCTFEIRFDRNTEYAGYNPEKYMKLYENAPGRTWKEKLNAMRRDAYAENKDQINEQKRAAYAARKENA